MQIVEFIRTQMQRHACMKCDVYILEHAQTPPIKFMRSNVSIRLLVDSFT